MVRIFLSDRILIDADFYDSGIAVGSDGKIIEVFKDRTKAEEWIQANSNVEVSAIRREGKIMV